MTLNGIDIARSQSGIDLRTVPCDFVIVGASDGGFVNPVFHSQYGQAKALGKLRGAYHFFRGNPDSEARFFVANAAEVAGDGQIWCDAETHVANLPQLTFQWLETVRSLTGVKPAGVYTMWSFMFGSGAYDWSPVINAGYSLWHAQYPTSSTNWGYGPAIAPPQSTWPAGQVMWQYSSSGRLAGWADNLDLNQFNGTPADWQALVHGKTSGTATTIKPTLEDTLAKLDKDDLDNIAKAVWGYKNPAAGINRDAYAILADLILGVAGVQSDGDLANLLRRLAAKEGEGINEKARQRKYGKK